MKKFLKVLCWAVFLSGFLPITYLQIWIIRGALDGDEAIQAIGLCEWLIAVCFFAILLFDEDSPFKK